MDKLKEKLLNGNASVIKANNVILDENVKAIYTQVNQNENNNITNNIATNISLSDNDVIAHTANLWKYQPIPDKPEKYPEYIVKFSKDDETGISIYGARVRGKMHKHDGSNCDDWFEFDSAGGMAFIAVADGAGSKPYSRIGAKNACQNVIKETKKLFTEFFNSNPSALSSAAKAFNDQDFTQICSKLAGLVNTAVRSTISNLEIEYDKIKNNEELINNVKRPIEFSDLSSTLLLTVVLPILTEESGKRENLIISIQIGDGMIASIDSKADFENALSLLGNADNGQFSGETEFITSSKMKQPESLMRRIKIQRKACSHIFLMTDGVADDYFPNDPEILRLFIDLKINNILNFNSINQLNYENKEIIEKLPKPEEYCWVNDNDVKYKYMYTSSVIDSTGLSLKELWKNKEIISYIAKNNNYNDQNNLTTEEKLKIWLDNYVKRGSFDDRTLVIIDINNGEVQ